MEIKTKYNIDDRVWVVYENIIRTSNGEWKPTGEVSIYDTKILYITIDSDNEIAYTFEDGDYTEVSEEGIILYEEKDKLLEKIEQVMNEIHKRESEGK